MSHKSKSIYPAYRQAGAKGAKTFRKARKELNSSSMALRSLRLK